MPLLEIRGLSKSFGGLAVLRDVSFTVGPGEVVGLIGPNGAGKTTVMNVVSGLMAPSAGSILFEGRNIAGAAPHTVSRLGLKRTFQTSVLVPGLTVLENVMFGLDRSARYGMLGAALTWPILRDERELADTALAALDAVGMLEFQDRRGNELSFGQQRMVELARVIASKPKVVLLDEPAVGLAPARIADLSAHIRRLAGEHGVAIVLIEHVIQLVLDVCQRAVVMNAGQVIADGRPEEVTNDPVVVESYLGRGYYHAHG